MPELIFLTYLMEGLLVSVFVLLLVAALVHNHRRGRKHTDLSVEEMRKLHSLK